MQQPPGQPQQPQQQQQAATPRPVWADSFRARTTDSAQRQFLRANLVSYGVSLTYDTVDGAGDEQRLLVGNYPNGSFGPLVRIEPALGTTALTDSQLHSGRIIARVINRDTAAGYQKFGIAPRDVAYWWADRVNGTWRYVLISTVNGTGRLVDALQDTTARTAHQQYQWQQPLARWEWSDQDDGLWATCTAVRCCRLSSGFFGGARDL